MRFKRPRGTQDIFGDRMDRWNIMEKRLIELAARFGYTEIRTPVFEVSDLFIRAVGEGSDIVSKEMYTFRDKKKRSLTLRPENTAPVMRAFLENGLHRRGGITRFFYIGPMFRYDRPQAGRFRQFHQFGVEALGSSNPGIDAEIIDLSLEVYKAFGFRGLEVRLNSVGCPKCRPSFIETLQSSLSGLGKELCDACSERAVTNPLRVFDCKDCDDVKKKLPVITDNLCDECMMHFKELQSLLTDMRISFVIDPLLVRGLDYYTKTAFEILHPGAGAQNALCGGGRYDGLAEDCGGPFIPAIGFSSGLERLLDNIPDDALDLSTGRKTDLFFAVPDQEFCAKAMNLASELRGAGFSIEVELSGRAMKKQLKTASESGACYTLILGNDEMEKDGVTIKDMETGGQVLVPFDEVVRYIKRGRKEKFE
ncbi:MAG: histidine--tRNA ligase [Candidatus Krumholzibacteriota bacterium]|nr:histidine--tRNA ligase [Candidatus Krumholzibacteriota bacterium]